MEDPADDKLRSMTQSLKRYADLASALKMEFAAQLLSMAVMEINIQLHAISPQELEMLCACIEEKPSSNVMVPSVSLIESGRYERRQRARRN